MRRHTHQFPPPPPPPDYPPPPPPASKPPPLTLGELRSGPPPTPHGENPSPKRRKRTRKKPRKGSRDNDASREGGPHMPGAEEVNDDQQDETGAASPRPRTPESLATNPYSPLEPPRLPPHPPPSLPHSSILNSSAPWGCFAPLLPLQVVRLPTIGDDAPNHSHTDDNNEDDDGTPELITQSPRMGQGRRKCPLRRRHGPPPLAPVPLPDAVPPTASRAQHRAAAAQRKAEKRRGAKATTVNSASAQRTAAAKTGSGLRSVFGDRPGARQPPRPTQPPKAGPPPPSAALPPPPAFCAPGSVPMWVPSPENYDEGTVVYAPDAVVTELERYAAENPDKCEELARDVRRSLGLEAWADGEVRGGGKGPAGEIAPLVPMPWGGVWPGGWPWPMAVPEQTELEADDGFLNARQRRDERLRLRRREAKWRRVSGGWEEIRRMEEEGEALLRLADGEEEKRRVKFLVDMVVLRLRMKRVMRLEGILRCSVEREEKKRAAMLGGTNDGAGDARHSDSDEQDNIDEESEGDDGDWDSEAAVYATSESGCSNMDTEVITDEKKIEDKNQAKKVDVNGKKIIESNRNKGATASEENKADEKEGNEQVNVNVRKDNLKNRNETGTKPTKKEEEKSPKKRKRKRHRPKQSEQLELERIDIDEPSRPFDEDAWQGWDTDREKNLCLAEYHYISVEKTSALRSLTPGGERDNGPPTDIPTSCPDASSQPLSDERLPRLARLGIPGGWPTLEMVLAEEDSATVRQSSRGVAHRVAFLVGRTRMWMRGAL